MRWLVTGAEGMLGADLVGFQLPGGAESAFAAMRSLVDTVPVFEAALGRDLDRIPGEIEGFLAGLSPGSVSRAC